MCRATRLGHSTPARSPGRVTQSRAGELERAGGTGGFCLVCSLWRCWTWRGLWHVKFGSEGFQELRVSWGAAGEPGGTGGNAALLPLLLSPTCPNSFVAREQGEKPLVLWALPLQPPGWLKSRGRGILPAHLHISPWRWRWRCLCFCGKQP